MLIISKLQTGVINIINNNNDNETVVSDNMIREYMHNNIRYLIVSLNFNIAWNESGYLSIQNQRCYAMTHSYSYKVFMTKDIMNIKGSEYLSTLITKSKHCHEHIFKVLMLNEIFINKTYRNSFDYLLYVDNDVLFTNFSKSLDEIIKIANYSQFIFSKKMFFINSGVMLFKNTQWIYDNVISLWWNLSLVRCKNDLKFKNDHQDQSILNVVLKGKTYNDFEKYIFNENKNNKTNQTVQDILNKWADNDCLGTHKKGKIPIISPKAAIQNCIHKKYHKYVTIIPSDIFNCIDHPINECMQFIQHFAGKRSLKTRKIKSKHNLLTNTYKNYKTCKFSD